MIVPAFTRALRATLEHPGVSRSALRGPAARRSGRPRSSPTCGAQRKVPGARVTKIEREWEHGHRARKIELHKGHREYRVYVSARTGKIVKFRQKYDD
ncbi:PepSY domain-containing protein [Sphaerisporangium sp. TRM90804]|uniref:PepSY domain-containing protein n=1 Tax=Sphaerisporangium sp. TRM90804 TaxID=3031113 RepID=UPI003267F1B4